MNRVWKLELTDEHGSHFVIHGSEDVLRSAIEEWIEGSPVKLVINGFCDTADRAEHTLAIKSEEIVAISLIKVY